MSSLRARLSSSLAARPSAFRPPRWVRAGAQAGVVALVVAGTAAYATRGHDVELVVDGERTATTTFARTAGDLLEAEGVEVGARDLVSHDLDAPLEDGSEVVVRHGRELTVVLDGEERTYWTTALSVDQALDELRIRAEGAELSTSRSASIGRGGLDLVVSSPKDVTVLVDGQTRTATSTAATVGDLLDELGVAVGASDRVSAPMASVLVHGQALRVTRMTTAQAQEERAVPAPVEERRSDALFAGERRVEAEGRDGRQVLTFEEVRADGQVVHRALVSEQVAEQPQPRVVLVGTKERPAPPAPAPAPARSSGGSSGGTAPAPSGGSSGLNWGALAACESGGNPTIVSSNGLYHGLYQFSDSTWRSVGGSGSASQASAAEQTARAQMLYDRSGASPWPHCGRRLFS